MRRHGSWRGGKPRGRGPSWFGASRIRKSNGEGARLRVKRWRRGNTSVARDRHREVLDSSRAGAATGEQGSVGQNGAVGTTPRKGLKHGEPHGRQSGATSRRGRGGVIRRGGEKPRGRNTVGVGRRRPEGRSRKGSSGSGLRDRVRRRGDLRQPQERQLGVPTPGGKSRTASGKTAPKVMREIEFTACVVSSAPEDGPRSPHVRRESETQ